MKAKNLSALHASIVTLFGAYKASNKADGADYHAVMKFLRAAPLNDAEAVKAMRTDLFETFGEDHKDAAQIRVNIINNARRVAFGGMKDGKAIRGKGHPAMLEVCATVQSVRELKKALAEAVPEALKGASGGDKKSGKGKKAKAKAIALPQVATRDEAFAAARKILEFVRDKFVKPSETARTETLNAAIASMTEEK